MNPETHKAICDELLGMVDDAISLAKEAAEAASKPAVIQERVVLTKVAHDKSRCAEVVDVLVKKGFVNSDDRQEMTRLLADGGPEILLDTIEKVAADANNFTALADDGRLTSKPSKRLSVGADEPNRDSALWRDAWTSKSSH